MSLDAKQKEREELAKRILQEGGHTCVFVTEEDVFRTDERGIKPLLNAISSGRKTKGAAVADKVVGKAAAFLYVLMEIRSLYVYTVSRPALDVLENAGIAVNAENVVEGIRNRTNTGPCPMEYAVRDVSDANEAYAVLIKKVEEMKGGKE